VIATKQTIKLQVLFVLSTAYTNRTDQEAKSNRESNVSCLIIGMTQQFIYDVVIIMILYKKQDGKNI